MKAEIEVKFAPIVIDDMRRRLTEVGARCLTDMREMRRAIIETPQLKEKHGFIRIRDEGDKCTVTYKQFDSLSISGAKEREIIVNDFADTVALFEEIGMSPSSVQESRRETWILENAEIVIDEWPWLNPYIEIEAESEREVRETAAQLGFDWNDALFGDVMAAYRRQYPHLQLTDTVASLAQVRFHDPLPALLIPTKETS